MSQYEHRPDKKGRREHDVSWEQFEEDRVRDATNAFLTEYALVYNSLFLDGGFFAARERELYELRDQVTEIDTKYITRAIQQVSYAQIELKPDMDDFMIELRSLALDLECEARESSDEEDPLERSSRRIKRTHNFRCRTEQIRAEVRGVITLYERTIEDLSPVPDDHCQAFIMTEVSHVNNIINRTDKQMRNLSRAIIEAL